MAAGLEVSTSAMNTRGEETVNAAFDLMTKINSLSSHVEELMTIWSGPSATAFNKSFEQEKNDLSRFKDLLDELGVNISKGANILNKTEEANAGLFGGGR